MEFLCFRGHWYTMGNNNIFEGALARFGKISMEFLHLGGFMRGSLWNLTGGGYEGITEIWENLNGVPSLWGFIKESNSCLKGAGDEYSHGPMRSTVCCINWGKLTHGEQWTNGSLQSRFGKIWRKVVHSSCPRETMIKFAQSWYGA